MAQRRASTMLDFPQPLGPTTAVIPGLSSMTVRSTKDLNPTISMLFKRIKAILIRQFCEGKSQAQALTAIFHTDRKSTRLNSSHLVISYAVFCLKKKIKKNYIILLIKKKKKKIYIKQ